jgi:hypothetical protein
MSAPLSIHEKLDSYWDFLRQEKTSGDLIIRFLGGERVGKTEYLTRSVEKADEEVWNKG